MKNDREGQAELDMLGDLEVAASELVEAARSAACAVDDAIWAFEDTAEENVSFEIIDMIDALTLASSYNKEAAYEIREFDRKLSSLIALRGKLAELTGIPMFSHIGANRRYPDTESYGV